MATRDKEIKKVTFPVLRVSFPNNSLNLQKILLPGAKWEDTNLQNLFERYQLEFFLFSYEERVEGGGTQTVLCLGEIVQNIPNTCVHVTFGLYSPIEVPTDVLANVMKKVSVMFE